MNPEARARILWLGAGLALAGCAHEASRPEPARPPLPPPEPRYEVVGGRGPDVVARLRAAPPPAQPDALDGHAMESDERYWGDQGLVQIGIGHFPAGDAQSAREKAIRMGHDVGADKLLMYTAFAAGGPDLVAVYYVHLRLPFGAVFRDLSAEERQQVGGDGVMISQVIGGTPASAANLRAGDFVLKLDRAPVRDKTTFQDLLQNHQGRRVTLTIRRNNVTLDRLVRLGSLASDAGH